MTLLLQVPTLTPTEVPTASPTQASAFSTTTTTAPSPAPAAATDRPTMPPTSGPTAAPSSRPTVASSAAGTTNTSISISIVINATTAAPTPLPPPQGNVSTASLRHGGSGGSDDAKAGGIGGGVAVAVALLVVGGWSFFAGSRKRPVLPGGKAAVDLLASPASSQPCADNPPLLVLHRGRGEGGEQPPAGMQLITMQAEASRSSASAYNGQPLDVVSGAGMDQLEEAASPIETGPAEPLGQARADDGHLAKACAGKGWDEL